MKTNETSTTRQQAMAWWNHIEYKNLIASKYTDITLGRTHENLTGREIEEIWKKETQYNVENDPVLLKDMGYKPNQKQFKQFDESLFKAYIDKFSDEDKIRCFDYLSKIMLQSGFSKSQMKQSIKFQLY